MSSIKSKKKKQAGIIYKSNGDMIINARKVPKNEQWLYKPENKKALASLRRGIKQAKQGKLKNLDLSKL